jgi:hypothetical protein
LGGDGEEQFVTGQSGQSGQSGQFGKPVADWTIDDVRAWLLYSPALYRSNGSINGLYSSSSTGGFFRGLLNGILSNGLTTSSSASPAGEEGAYYCRGAIDPLLLRTYAHAFSQARVDGMTLLDGLTVAEIKGMGVPLGDAKKLYAEVQELAKLGGAPVAQPVQNVFGGGGGGSDGGDSGGSNTAGISGGSGGSGDGGAMGKSSSVRGLSRPHVRARSVAGRRGAGREQDGTMSTATGSPPVEIQLTERLLLSRSASNEQGGAESLHATAAHSHPEKQR